MRRNFLASPPFFRSFEGQSARIPGWALGLCLALSPVTTAAAPVEASHPVAGFLRRLEEKGVIAPGFYGTLPRDRAEIAATLAEATARPARLTAWDRRRLEGFLDEFDAERLRRGTRLRLEDSVFSARGHVEWRTSATAVDSVGGPAVDGFSTLAIGGEGHYGDNLRFTAQAFVGRAQSLDGRFLENYDPQRGLPYNTSRGGKGPFGVPQKVSTLDGFRAMVGYNDGRLALEAGQDWNQWGPGRWQHATLGTRPHFWVTDSLGPEPLVGFEGTETTFASVRRGYRVPGEGAPLPQVRLRLKGSRWEYVKIVAERMALKPDSAAWLVAHRAQLRLGALTFGVTEMLSIGGRAPDLITMLPGVPLKFAEHENGDLDNTAMAADLEWRLTGHGRVYAELFVDDYSGPPLDFRGNKFAVVLGGSWQDPFALPATLHLEYAHVDPWTYGHHRYNTAMQHYGALLGSSLPPNSRAVTLAADFPLPGGLEGAAEWRLRQRDIASRGSSIFDVFVPGEPTTKDFLETNVETRHEVQFTAAWNWRRHVRLRAGAGGLWAENWRGHHGASLATPLGFTDVTLHY